MASDRCGGGGRSSGTGLEGVTPACPGPSIVGKPARRRRRTGTKREYAHRPAPPASGFSRKGSRPGPAKPQQGCPPDAGGKRIARSDRLRRNGIHQRPPDDVRRSASLSISSARDRVRTRDRAREHLPPPDRCAVCPPPEGRSLRTGALFPLWGKTTAKRSVGGKGVSRDVLGLPSTPLTYRCSLRFEQTFASRPGLCFLVGKRARPAKRDHRPGE